MEDAIVGPMLSCLVTDQFMRLKRGDSYWYERKVGPQSFSQGTHNHNPLVYNRINFT